MNKRGPKVEPRGPPKVILYISDSTFFKVVMFSIGYVTFGPTKICAMERLGL